MYKENSNYQALFINIPYASSNSLSRTVPNFLTDRRRKVHSYNGDGQATKCGLFAFKAFTWKQSLADTRDENGKH